MRKAMGKKIAEKMRAERENFRTGAVAKGYTAQDADKIFDLIEPFAGYAFNKAHATCYGTISYQTAFLKATYAAEYMTAVLQLADNHPAGFADRVAAAVAECARLEIAILPPDVNKSDATFRIEALPDGRSGIRFGLATVKNVGESAVEGLIEERTENGPFSSLEDFCRRASLRNANKRMLESLIKVGALDCFAEAAGQERNTYRSTLLFNVDRIMSLVQREQKLKDAGQTTMFDLFGESMPTPMPELELLATPSLPGKELLGYEKELMGVYVSEHPFKAAALALAQSVDMLINEVSAETAGRGEVRLAGMVTATRPLLTKDGRAFCAATIEDLTGQVEVTVWPDQYEPAKELWTEGKILRLTARIRPRDERLNVTVVSAAEYDPTGADPLHAVVQEVEAATGPRRTDGNGYRNGNGNGYKNGSGNGYRNGNGNGAAAPAGPPPRLLVRIEVTERPEDEADDRQRLTTLVQHLRSAPGKDTVRLVVVTRAERHELELPPIALTPVLEERIKPLLFKDNWGQLYTEALATA
jgi:DNA polymerase-3 subunit alpha